MHAAADDGFEMSLVPLPPSFGLERGGNGDEGGKTDARVSDRCRARVDRGRPTPITHIAGAADASADDGFEMSLVPLPPSFSLGGAGGRGESGRTDVHVSDRSRARVIEGGRRG